MKPTKDLNFSPIFWRPFYSRHSEATILQFHLCAHLFSIWTFIYSFTPIGPLLPHGVFSPCDRALLLGEAHPVGGSWAPQAWTDHCVIVPWHKRPLRRTQARLRKKWNVWGHFPALEMLLSVLCISSYSEDPCFEGDD